MGLALPSPGLWQGGGRETSPIPPDPNYGFITLLPLEQECSAPPLCPHLPKLWREAKGKPLRNEGPLCAWDLAGAQGLMPHHTHTPSATPVHRSPLEAGHSEVDTQHVLAGKRTLAGGARHGQGALLLAQAGPAQEVAAGELVHRLLFEVGRKRSFAGGALGPRGAPMLLW